MIGTGNETVKFSVTGGSAKVHITGYEVLEETYDGFGDDDDSDDDEDDDEFGEVPGGDDDDSDDDDDDEDDDEDLSSYQVFSWPGMWVSSVIESVDAIGVHHED